MLLNFNSPVLLIFFSLILQLFVFHLVIYFGYIYFLLLELWMFLVILFFNTSNSDYVFFIFIFYILFFTSVLISILFLSCFCEFFILLFFMFIVFNVLFFTLMMFLFYNNDFIIFNNQVLVIYIFNFKLFIFLYVFLFFDSCSILILLMLFLDFNYLFLLFWFIFFIVMINVLLLGDLESYLFIVLNFSHYILFLSCFLNISIFLYCSFLDCLVCFLVFQFIYLNYVNFTNSFLSYYTSLFLFLFVCHSYGIPPFPSFLLEVCLLFVFVSSLGYLFSYFFIVFFYITILLNFIFIFDLIGNIDNSSLFSYNVLSDNCFLLLILFFGIFLTCFFNIFIVFIC